MLLFDAKRFFRMLAPRKTLWSTPSAVVEQAIAWCGPLSPNDCVVDIGCGDGRCLLQWATHYSATLPISSSNKEAFADGSFPTVHFIGIDIDAKRIQHAKQSWQQAVEKGDIDARINVEFHCQNALEAFDIFGTQATVIFLYLIPRGLRKIKPLLRQINHPVQVITYMSPLPEETPVHRTCIKVPHQPNAEWPVYAYRLNTDMETSEG